MKLGVFGGTFDPPHLAHLILADEAYHQLGLEKVLWVLTPYPPHKQDRLITPVEYRLEMLSAAIASNPAFEISRVDIDRSPPHYAMETMYTLAKNYPEAGLIYLMGGDSLRDLPVWYRPLDFLAACHALGVMRRPNDEVDMSLLETLLPGIGAKVRFVMAPLIEMSGAAIRRRVAEGKPFRYYLPQIVYQIIQERGLYRSREHAL